jgi:hypothetical protein
MRQNNAEKSVTRSRTRFTRKHVVALGALLGLVTVILSGCVFVPVGGGYGYDHPHHRYGRPYSYPYRYYQG